MFKMYVKIGEVCIFFNKRILIYITCIIYPYFENIFTSNNKNHERITEAV